MNGNATVYVVDDDPGMRKSLRALVESAGLPALVFASAGEFLQHYRPGQPGCVLLDLRMPEMGGLELLQQLRPMQTGIPIIVITGHADVPSAVESMKLGVLDFLQKPVNPGLLVAKVWEALAIDASRRQQSVEAEALRERIAKLTDRERELLQLLIQGKSNKQIAMELHLSIKTIQNHRAHIMAKTQAVNVADLVRLGVMARGGPRT